MNLRIALFLLMSAGCEGLIGADFDRGIRVNTDADSEPEADAAIDELDAGVDAKTARDSSQDASLLAPGACGDTAGLDMAGGFPIANACPTRSSHVEALPPIAPRIKSRFVLGPARPGLGFVSSPVVRGDGTVFAVASLGLGDAGGFRYVVLGVRNGIEVQRTELPTSFAFGATPTVAADGTLYVQADKLFAISSTGTLLWSRPLEGTQPGSPLVLSGGTIVVASGKTIVAFDRSGTQKFLTRVGTAITDPSARLSITGSTTGTLYAALDPGAGSLNGELNSLSTGGTLLWSKPLVGRPAASPMVYSDGRVFVKTGGGGGSRLMSFLSSGTTDIVISAPDADEGGSFAGVNLWFSVRNPFRYNVASQVLTGVSVAGRRSAMTSFRDGSLVMLRSASVEPRPLKLERWDSAGNPSWNVEMEYDGSDLFPVAVDARGNIYATYSASLYAVGD
jgi:PQQ-like domain